MPFLKHIQRYPQTSLLLLCILLTLLFSLTPWFLQAVIWIHQLGYVGVLLSGALFVSAFTATGGTLLLVNFTDVYSPLEVAFIGTLGAVLMDFLMYRLVSSQFKVEWQTAYRRHVKKRRNVHLFLKSPLAQWMIPLLGAIIIMSPLPDELGVGFLGVSKLHPVSFFFLAFFLNFLGIVSLIGAVGLFV